MAPGTQYQASLFFLCGCASDEFRCISEKQCGTIEHNAIITGHHRKGPFHCTSFLLQVQDHREACLKLDIQRGLGKDAAQGVPTWAKTETQVPLLPSG